MRARYAHTFWQVLVVGYLTFGRSFAYLGIPPLFIGEFFIGREVYLNKRRWLNRFVEDIIQMRMLSFAVAATLLWGVFEVVRSIYFRQSAIEVLKTFVFSYYPICLIIGLSIGQTLTMAAFIRFFKFFAVFFSFYGIVQAGLGAADVRLTLPWASQVYIFNTPALTPLIPVGILILWPFLKDWKWRFWVFLLSMAPLFFDPGRGPLLGLFFGLVCLSLVSVRRVFNVTFGMILLFLVMMVVGKYLPAVAGRAENMDPIFGVARVLATVNEDLARDLLNSAGYHNTSGHVTQEAGGTADWRKNLWKSALGSLNTTSLQLMGQGHGANLTQHVPDGTDVRTPHNFAVFALFYTGIIGLAVYVLLIGTLMVKAYMIPERNLSAFLMSMILMATVMALVGNMFEAPFCAIPFYLLCGVILGMTGEPLGDPRYVPGGVARQALA